MRWWKSSTPAPGWSTPAAGAFRSRVPSGPGGLDPAGFVKGWAAERAAGLLTAAGLRHWYLSVGGDVQGPATPGRAWRVAIADPVEPGGVVAPSPSTRCRGHVGHRRARRPRVGRPHRWPGRAGWRRSPSPGPASRGPTPSPPPSFALGADGPSGWPQFDGYHALAVTLDGRVVADPVLAAHAAA